MLSGRLLSYEVTVYTHIQIDSIKNPMCAHIQCTIIIQIKAGLIFINTGAQHSKVNEHLCKGLT